MELAIWLNIVNLFFIINCQNTVAQKRDIGTIKMITDNKIEFVDHDIETNINGSASVYIRFKDSDTLFPDSVSVHLIKMEESCQTSENVKIDFTFFLITSRRSYLNNKERILLEKYIPKIDSISMNSHYEFIGGKENFKSAILVFPFEIKPGIRSRRN